MALQLYMVGLTVQDMEKSKEFYRRLGLAVSEESENPQFPVSMFKMNGEFSLLLASRSIESEPTASGKPLENYRAFFEYYLKSQAAVEAKYEELIRYGYQSYHAPFIFFNGMCFALVNDPDGNTILLSGDVEK